MMGCIVSPAEIVACCDACSVID